MKFILLSDIHELWQNPVCRLDNLVETQFEKLAFVWDYAKEIGATILQAGDWHNTPRGYGLLSKEMDLLKKYEVDCFAVFGQHDTYFYSEETRDATSLGILEKAGLVTVLGQHHIRFLDESGRQKINLYGASYGQDVPEIEGGADVNILVLHASIAEKALWPGHDYMDARKFLREYEDFDLILCGDIHKKFLIEEEGRVICNTGCMLRISVDLWDHKPCFYVYDTKKKLTHIEEVEIPHEVAAKVLSREHIEKEKQITMMLDKFVKSVSNDFNIESDFTGNLWKFVKENKIDREIVNILSGIMEEKV